MKEEYTYDPEDIEKLLQSKSYAELIRSEKEFVDLHIDSEEAYEQMRSLLQTVENQPWDNVPNPPSGLKNVLIKKHQDKHKKSLSFWLNSMFAMNTQRRWYQQPILQLGIATVLIATVFITLQQKQERTDQLAITDTRQENAVDNKKKTQESTPIRSKEKRQVEESEGLEIPDKTTDLAEVQIPPPIPEISPSIEMPTADMTDVASDEDIVLTDKDIALYDIPMEVISSEIEESSVPATEEMEVEMEIEEMEADNEIVEKKEQRAETTETTKIVDRDKMTTDLYKPLTIEGMDENARGQFIVPSIALKDQLSVLDMLFEAY